MTVIVITGPSGSGKTLLANMIAEGGKYAVANVGARLQSMLVDVGIVVGRKELIGDSFLQRFGLDAYHDVVREIATVEYVVIDGLRLPSGLAMLPPSPSEVTLVYRPGRVLERREDVSADPDLDYFARHAQFVVPWAREVGSLRTAAVHILQGGRSTPPWDNHAVE